MRAAAALVVLLAATVVDVSATDDPPPSSCAAGLAANPAASNGAYQITTPSGAVVTVLCDMANGGWTRVFNVPGSMGSNGPNPMVVDAVGSDLSVDTSFGKLSDYDISRMSGDPRGFHVKCLGTNGNAVLLDVFMTNDRHAWDSRPWQDSGLSWTVDVNADGVPDCNADRSAPYGYTFSTYGQASLNAVCDASGMTGNNHFNWGSDGGGGGCYPPGGSWGGARGEVWVGPSGRPRVMRPPPTPPPRPSPPPPQRPCWMDPEGAPRSCQTKGLHPLPR